MDLGAKGAQRGRAPERSRAPEVDASRLNAEATWRALLESAPDAIIAVDGDGRILFANLQTERLFGYLREELLGRTIEDLVPDRFRGDHVAHRSRYADTPHPRAMGAGLELFARRKDGSEFPVEISLSPVTTDAGPLVASAIRDVTDRRRASELLAEQAATLRRQAELLDGKNVALERANRAKDRFLARVSHELRTPLNAILGFTGTLLTERPGPVNPAQRRQLTTVRDSARYLLSLINDILDITKIESGHVQLSPEPLDCSALISDVLAILGPLATEKHLELAFASDGKDCDLLCDRRALQQIVFNIVGNAIKFTDHGSVIVSLCTRGTGADAIVEIRVRDTGIGVRREDHARIFEEFVRAEGTDRKDEGAGLGLHLSRRLAEMLGATIHLDSEPGRGSTFTIELPARASTVPSSPESAG